MNRAQLRRADLHRISTTACAATQLWAAVRGVGAVYCSGCGGRVSASKILINNLGLLAYKGGCRGVAERCTFGPYPNIISQPCTGGGR